ncbi:MAG: formate dehydrogenase accessory sulfurtransferase FdhD [Myxococcales bacterium]|nr:formate dehydrogenase accessory sulfurtransferase FdhD [Myxococcales bacterium]
MPRPTTAAPVRVVDARGVAREDVVAAELPLQVRVAVGAAPPRDLVITMRTPGADVELAAGYLFAEHALGLDGPHAVEQTAPDVVTVTLPAGAGLELAGRASATTSACGACGKETVDALGIDRLAPVVATGFGVAASVLHALPGRLRDTQPMFAQTGGLHGAAAFDRTGAIAVAFEDVGRHNAVDKVVGRLLLDGALPAVERGLVVSGRTSFEVLQKATRAGFPVVAAVGAPSSFAVELAQRLGITLVGFLTDRRFNVYSHPERIEFEHRPDD